MADVMTYLPLRSVLAGWRDGDEREGGWEEEFRFLRTEHFESLMDLTRSVIRGGIREPILLGSDGRVWDGHHRLCVADGLYLDYVPVAFSEPEASRSETMRREERTPSRRVQSWMHCRPRAAWLARHSRMTMPSGGSSIE